MGFTCSLFIREVWQPQDMSFGQQESLVWPGSPGMYQNREHHLFDDERI